MSGRRGWFSVAVCLGALLVVSTAHNYVLATEYRYQGVEVVNLRTAFNANSTLLQGVMNDVEDVVAKLNSSDLDYANFACTNSGSTTDTLGQ